MSNWIRIQDDEKFPSGKCALTLDNNGFVGTNNGWPMAGQPALYPTAQAVAMATAWSYMLMDGEKKVEEKYPHLRSSIGEEAWLWLFGQYSRNHT